LIPSTSKTSVGEDDEDEDNMQLDADGEGETDEDLISSKGSLVETHNVVPVQGGGGVQGVRAAVPVVSSIFPAHRSMEDIRADMID
jgi:hypothetical protein